MKLKMITAMAMLMCILFAQASVGYCAPEDGTALQMADLFKSREMEPNDIRLKIPAAEEGDDFFGAFDMFPMEADFDERTEVTAEYWALYDAVMGLNLVQTTVEPGVGPKYELYFYSPPRDPAYDARRLRMDLYYGLNIADVSIKDEGEHEYTFVGRYFILDRLELNAIFSNIEKFIEDVRKIGN